MSAPAWTAEEIATLRRLYPSAPMDKVYAALPGRSAGTIKVYAHKFGIRRSKSAWRTAIQSTQREKKSGATRAPVRPEGVVSSTLIADRDARAAAAERRDQTATFFGDPPPGYSALDQLKSAAATPPPTSPDYREAQGAVAGKVRCGADSTPVNPRHARYPQVRA